MRHLPALATLGAVSLALASLTAGPALAQRAIHAGRVVLAFTIHDRGVAHVSNLHYALDAELEVGPDRRATLRVRGTLERTAAFLVPPGGLREEGRARLEIDQTHRGTIVQDDRDAFVVQLDPDARGVSHPWRCARTRERVGERDRALLRCEGATPHTGLPWRDPLPAYLRAPMVLARGGGVRADVTASQDHGASVYVAPGS